MAKAYTGRDGRLVFKGDVMVKVANWSLETQLEMLDITTLGDSHRRFKPGVLAYSGSATLLYYKDSGRNDASRILREIINTDADGIADNADVAMRLRFVDGDILNEIAFQAFITSASIAASVGEVVSAQISFQVDGPLTTVTI